MDNSFYHHSRIITQSVTNLVTLPIDFRIHMLSVVYFEANNYLICPKHADFRWNNIIFQNLTLLLNESDFSDEGVLCMLLKYKHLNKHSCSPHLNKLYFQSYRGCPSIVSRSSNLIPSFKGLNTLLRDCRGERSALYQAPRMAFFEDFQCKVIMLWKSFK